MPEITPEFVQTFQTNLNVRFSRGWKRTLANLWFQRLAITQPSSALTENYEWMLESANIRPTGSAGSEIDFEGVCAIPFSITNENFGTSLKLSRNSIEDNKYDRAAQWGSSAGDAGCYWPQRQIASLILNGKTKHCYDGLPFFHASHPVNPYDDTLGTFPNLFTGKPLTSANLGIVCAAIEGIIHPGNAPRFLKPTILAVDPTNKLNANVVTGAEVIIDPLNANKAAAATNMIKVKYGFGEPLVVPEFSSEPGVWYVGCEADEDALQGAFLYQERKPFELTSYNGMTQSDLDRMNEFEWHLRGRNTAAYGHPYLFFRVEPT